MTSANRTRITMVRENTPGVTPNTPRMRTMRITGESLRYTPQYVDPDEIRDDRMMGDPIKVMIESGGGLNFEVSFPEDKSPLSEIYAAAAWNDWANTPTRDNDGAAAGVIKDVANSGGVVTVEDGAAFVAGHLVRFTGFGVSANNGVFLCTTGSATVPAFAGQGLQDEAVPAADARMKVVGIQADEGDIAAVADGLTSNTLDFTDFPQLTVGRWIKIGGTGANRRFATAANNGWARIAGVAAKKLTLDNLPAGWTADAGEYAALRIFFGDQLKNGVTPIPLTIEKGFMGQAVPTYIVNRGMHGAQLDHSITSRQKITGSISFMGLAGSVSNTSLDDTPVPATTNQVMAANANVGRIAENGSRLVDGNWAQSLTFTINNNTRSIEAADSDAPVGVDIGECTVTGQITTYFGSKDLLQKLFDGTPTSINSRVAKNNQAIIYQFPRVTYRDGAPNATAKNTDVMLPLNWQASKDEATSAHFLFDRLEYFEE